MKNKNQEEFEFVQLKTCIGCKEDKTIDKFDRQVKNKPARRHTCRLCRNADWVKYYQSNPEFREHNIKRNQCSRDRKNHFINEYKLTHPCIKCGEEDPMVLEFDHRDRGTKSFNIAHGAARKSLRLIEEEMAKCDVMCANCHRRKTAKQLGYYSYKATLEK